MSAGVFNPEARAAILEAGEGRCIGCGATNLTCQHRDSRGMGGNRRPHISSPANGLPLCGSGTHGCHGWTERHPLIAERLGWRLISLQDPLDEPFWTRHGWRQWTVEVTDQVQELGMFAPIPGRAFYAVAYVDATELDRLTDRLDAVAEFGRRAPGWRS